MRTALLILCLISAPHPASSDQKTTNPTQSKAQTNAQPSKPTPPSVAEKNPPAETANQNSGTVVSGPNERAIRIVSLPPRSTGDTVALICTIALTLVGIGGIIIAICTLKKIEEQTKHAKTSAEIASSNIQLLFNTERSLIDVNLAAPTTYIDNETGEEYLITPSFPENLLFRYSIAIKNHGRTVARIICYRIWRDCSAHEKFNRNNFKIWFEESDQLLLGADKPGILGHIDFDKIFTDEEWPDVQKGTKNAMIRIDAVYKDVLKDGPEGQHETSVIFQWDVGKEEPRRLAQYNNYT